MSCEITLLLCECCFDIILEDDAEYHEELPYCHHCVEEIHLLMDYLPVLITNRPHSYSSYKPS